MKKDTNTMNFPNKNTNDQINFLSADNGEIQIHTEQGLFTILPKLKQSLKSSPIIQ